jgi:dTDP-L-rhamnose 4-epimerase
MKILITGGAGFIGSNLALKLIEKNHELVILDNLSTQIHGDNPTKTSSLFKSIEGKCEFILGDVRNVNDWKKCLENTEVVIHLAAETGTGQSMYQISQYTEVNIQGTSHLLDLLANTKHKVQKVIIASSRAIYGEGKYYHTELGDVYPGQRLDEDMALGFYDVKYKEFTDLQLKATDENSKIHPTSIYGITKQNQEQMILCACKSLGIVSTSFRFQNVYGPGQSLKNPYTGILSIFSTLIKNNQPINIFEDGNESRDFVYIDDIVHATILGVESDKGDGEAFNVGAGKSVSVIDVANLLKEKYGSTVELNISGNYRLGDIRHNYADIEKIKTYFGFEPKVDFPTGITNFTNWVNEQEIETSLFQNSMNEMKSKGLLK